MSLLTTATLVARWKYFVATKKLTLTPKDLVYVDLIYFTQLKPT